MKYINWFLGFLPFIAIIYLGIYLSKIEVSFSEVHLNFGLLSLSLLLLLSVFFLRAFIWKKIVNRYNSSLTYKSSVISSFKPILTKYIPGKIWMFISQGKELSHYDHSLKKGVVISVITQVFYILTGLFVGIFACIIFDINIISKTYLILLFILVCLTILSLLIFDIKKIIVSLHIPFSKKIKNIEYKIKFYFFDCILLLLQWLLLGLAYLVFFRSLDFNVSYKVIFLQPLANNIGILTFFVPAGLGVREGVMILLYRLINPNTNFVSTIVILSRIWFVFVELVVFIIGFLLFKNSKSSSDKLKVGSEGK